MTDHASLARITFIVPFVHMSGGIRVVFEHARELKRRGHTVTIACPDSHPAPARGLGRLRAGGIGAYRRYASFRRIDPVSFFGLRDDVVRYANPRDPSQIPDGDVVIATAWITAHWLAKYPRRLGHQAYLIQDYENWDAGTSELVDATWRLPITKLAVSTWLRELGRARFGVDVHGPILNGVDFELFSPLPQVPRTQPAGSLTVGLQYHPAPRKGMEYGLDALAHVIQRNPQIRVVMFGHSFRPRGVPFPFTYVRNPRQRQLADLYRHMNIFVSPSVQEGWGLPATEAMASRRAVVATESSAVSDYAIPGETALVVPPRRADLLAEEIVALVEDPERLRMLRAAGQRHIQSFTWPRATSNLLEALAAATSTARSVEVVR
jgi:glycosyltransferase involved in cell wall biosynthesis